MPGSMCLPVDVAGVRTMSHDGCMPTTGVRRAPEDEHLAEQERLLAELTEQLATKEVEFASAGSAFARFRVSYHARFAPLYAELDRLEAEILRLVAERTPPDAPEAEASQAQAQAEEAEARADESESAAEGTEEDPGLQPEPSADLKALFRQVARAVHPDLAEDDEDRARRNRLMAAANQAYDDGDEGALRRILDGDAARPEAVKGDDFGARLARVVRKIAQVRARFTELVELHASLEADPMWELFHTVHAARERGENPLADTEAGLRTQIRAARAQLAALRAEGRA